MEDRIEVCSYSNERPLVECGLDFEIIIIVLYLKNAILGLDYFLFLYFFAMILN